jgi:hypothetical protein
MSEIALYVGALVLGWFLVGAASAFMIAAAFFGIKEEKNLEEKQP